LCILDLADALLCRRELRAMMCLLLYLLPTYAWLNCSTCQNSSELVLEGIREVLLICNQDVLPYLIPQLAKVL